MFDPATVVLFAGAGGTCIGIEQAYVDGGFRDKYVDLAINHWTTAVGVHELNHPMTQHLRADVREVDPDSVLPGREIAYLHASPDCTHFSKARGSKPKKKEIRGLAWVVVDWAKKRQPTVITLENVEEFRSWGPLAKNGQPCHRRRGSTYRQWVKALRGLGYELEDRELRACDYGAPTTRKRLFVVARCDGKSIVWPEKTHGDTKRTSGLVQKARVGVRRSGRRESGDGIDDVRSQQASRDAGPRGVGAGHDAADGRASFVAGEDARAHQRLQLKPFRTAAECIRWDLPMLSIFATPAQAKQFAEQVNAGRPKHERIGTPRRPLKPKTMDRIFGGLVKWVLKAKRPFIVRIAHGDASDGGPRWGHATHSIDEPLGTVAASKDFAVADVTLAPFASTLNHSGDEHRGADLRTPLATVTGANDARAIVAAHVTKFRGDSLGTAADAPLDTITGGGATVRPAGAAHAMGVTTATLAPYSIPRYGEREGQSPRSGSIECPMATITGTGNQATLVAAMITKHYTGVVGHGADQPLDTITATDHNAISVAYLSHFYTSNTAGGRGDPAYPAKCITSGGQHAAVCVAIAKPQPEGTTDGSATRFEAGDSIAAERPVSDVRTHEDVGHDDVSRRLRDADAGHEEGALPAGGRGIRGGRRGGDEGTGREDASRSDEPGQVAAPFTIGAGGPAYAGKPKSVDAPFGTVMVDDRRAVVAAFLDTYYGNSKHGTSPAEPMPTVVSKDRISLVTVVIDEITYVVTDIAMRMLTPKELLLAQGFPADYRVDMTSDGQHVTKADQVKLIGNSVPPSFARAITRANVVDLFCVGGKPRQAVSR